MLVRSDDVVPGKVCMRRTGRILQAEGHEHRALDPVGEILNVEVPEHVEELLFAYALLARLLLDSVQRPRNYAGIVRIVTAGAQALMRWSRLTLTRVNAPP